MTLSSILFGNKNKGGGGGGGGLFLVLVNELMLAKFLNETYVACIRTMQPKKKKVSYIGYVT